MAVDHYLKKIETLLSPGPNESPTGFITAEDLREAFGLVLLAIDETYALQEDEVVGALLETAGKSNTPTYQVVNDLRNVLAKWSATIDSSTLATRTKSRAGLFGTVTGEAAPTTVAQVTQLVNNLIRALAEAGLVRDGRANVPVSAPPAVVAVTGLTAPTGGSLIWAFAPANATLPADLAALKANPVVGDAALVAATQPAFGPGAYIVLADGGYAAFNGTEWVAFTAPIKSVVPPTGGSKEWTFSPPGAAAPADLAALKAHSAVGDDALTGVRDFVSGEFVTLADGSTASYTADPGVGADPAGSFSWKAGVAP